MPRAQWYADPDYNLGMRKPDDLLIASLLSSTDGQESLIKNITKWIDTLRTWLFYGRKQEVAEWLQDAMRDMEGVSIRMRTNAPQVASLLKEQRDRLHQMFSLEIWPN